jgi:hypothetical protein
MESFRRLVNILRLLSSTEEKKRSNKNFNLLIATFLTREQNLNSLNNDCYTHSSQIQAYFRTFILIMIKNLKIQINNYHINYYEYYNEIYKYSISLR